MKRLSRMKQRIGGVLAGIFTIVVAAVAQELDTVYFEPIPNASPEALENQVRLWQRARHAATLVPVDLVTTTTSVSDYRGSLSHGATRRTLQALVDNRRAWPEYIYVARLTPDRAAYEYLVSSSDVIENHALKPYELSAAMLQALQFGKPYVTDITGRYPSCCIPYYTNDKPVGFLVFVKMSWEPDQRNVLLQPATLEEAAFLRLLSLETRSGLDRKLTAPPSSSSAPAFRPPPSASLPAEAPPVAQPLPAAESGHMLLGYGEGRMDGKRSLGGGGHAIRFTRPDDAPILHAIHLFGSRYGYPKAPDEDFNVHILDESMNVLHTLEFPYASFERGSERWVGLAAGDIEVPLDFWIAVDFNPHQTKGVYLGFENTGSPSHSKIGIPEKGFKDWEAQADWMIRVDVKKSPRDMR